MKLTVNLEEALLLKAVEVTGASTKTEAITTALRELTRRSELKAVLRQGTGLTSDELKDSLDPYSVSEFLRSRNLSENFQIASRLPNSAESS